MKCFIKNIMYLIISITVTVNGYSYIVNLKSNDY